MRWNYLINRILATPSQQYRSHLYRNVRYSSACSVEVDSINGKQALPLIQDPRIIQEFKDFKQISVETIETLNSLGIRSPTKLQKDMLSVLYSGGSVIATSDPGLGKSIAMALFLSSTYRTLNEFHNNKSNFAKASKNIESLVLVPSVELGDQISHLLQKLSRPSDTERLEIQHIYRSNEADEIRQLEKLQKHTPAILVAQPTILLDFLCHPTRELIPLHSLTNIIIEEAQCFYRATKKIKHERPLSLLLNYLVEWRMKYTNKELLKYEKSSENIAHETRNNQKLPLRNDKSEIRIIISSCQQDCIDFTDFWINESSRPLIDVRSGNYISTENLIEVSNCKGENLAPIYNSLSKHKSNSKTKTAKQSVKFDINNYIEGVRNVLNTTDDVKQKALVLIPETFSTQWIVSEFYKQGLFAVTITSNVPYFHFRDEQGNIQKMDQKTMFLNQESSIPYVLVLKHSQLFGLNFPGLEKIILLTPHAVSSIDSLINLRFILRPNNKNDSNPDIPITMLADTDSSLHITDNEIFKELKFLFENAPKDCIAA